MKILYCNVSCDFRPIRCKNHLMQLTFFIFYYSSGKTWNTFIHVSFFAAVCTALYHCVSFFFVRALMFLSSLRPWIFWVICWAGLEVHKAILVECLSCTIQHHLNQKWWYKGLKVARSALKTVHSGQFDTPPPQKKKNIYIYIYLATPPCLITAAQFHHELTPSYSFPCPCPPTYCSQWKL